MATKWGENSGGFGNSSGGFGSSSGGFGGSSSGFGDGGGSGGGQDLTSAELLVLAKLKGGRVGQIADELSGNQSRSILTQAGQGLKSLGGAFFDAISLSGEIVAGAIGSVKEVSGIGDESSHFSIAEAIKEHKRIDEAIFGTDPIFGEEGNQNTMEKIGGFVVRAPFTVLLDPLTWVTGGASAANPLKAAFGFGSNMKISVYEQAAKTLGVNLDEGGLISKAMTDFGSKDIVRDYLIPFSKQRGKKLVGKEAEAELRVARDGVLKKFMDEGYSLEDSAGFVKKLEKDIQSQLKEAKKLRVEKLTKAGALVEKDSKELMKATFEQPFNPNFAKKAMSNLLEWAPGLTEIIIDKGGLKVFAKTILSAQRIKSIREIIPGMKWADEATLPARNSVLSLFDPGLQKLGKGAYKRLPEEYLEAIARTRSLVGSATFNFIKQMQDVADEFKLNKNEMDILSSNIHARSYAEDNKLTEAYFKVFSVKKDLRDMFIKSGIPVTDLSMHTGLIGVPNNTKGMFTKVPEAAVMAKDALFLKQAASPEIFQQIPEIKTILTGLDKYFPDLTDSIKRVRSVEEVREKIGDKIDTLVQELHNKGIPIRDAVQNPRVKKLKALQDTIVDYKTEGNILGNIEMDKAGLLVRNTDDDIKAILKETDSVLERAGLDIKGYEKEIGILSEGITNVKQAKIAGQITGKLTGDSGTDKILSKIIEDFVGADDLKRLGGFGDEDLIKLKAGQLKELSQETAEDVAKSIKGVSKENSLEIITKALKEYKVTRVNIEEANSAVRKYLDELESKAKKATGETGEKAVKEVLSDADKKELAKIISETKASKAGMVKENLDPNAMSKLVQVLKQEFINNPTGVKTMLLRIIGNENKIKNVLALIDETKLATQKSLSLLPEEAYYFKSRSGDIFKRVGTTAQDLEAVGITGYDKNLLTAYTVRGMQSIKQLVGHQLAEGLVRNFGRWANEAPEKWVTMSSALVNDEAKQYAKLFIREDGMEMKFNPAIAKHFENMVTGLKSDEVSKGFMESYDKVQNYYKAYLTTIFPMFHGRNAISNVMLNVLAMGVNALNPVTHFGALDLMIKNGKYNSLLRKTLKSGDEGIYATQELKTLLSTKVFEDRAGYSWTFGELRKTIQDNGIAFSPRIMGNADIEDYRSIKNILGLDEGIKDKVFKYANKPKDLGMWVGGQIEGQSRMVNFLGHLKDTGDVSHAVMRTNQFLFDYQNLTKFEKDYMKRIIPFYTFTRKNLEVQFKTLIHNPGRINMEIEATKSLGSLLGGEEMTDEEKKLLPSWLQSNINLKRKKDGGDWEVISGFGTPIEQPFQAINPNVLAGSISPIIKFPIETLTGYNFFRGKATSQITDAHDFRGAPEVLKEFIGYDEHTETRKDKTKYTRYISMRPENMNILLSLPYSRIVSTLSQITDSDISGSMRALGGITGIKTTDFDQQRLEAKQENDLRKDLETLLQLSGIRGQFIRGYNKKGTTTIEN